MAVRGDLLRLQFLATKGVRIIDAAAQTITSLDPGDTEAETQINLTPGQRQAILDRLTPVLTEIHTISGRLP